MSRRISMIALLGTATLAWGCGSSHDATGTGGASGTGGTTATGGSGETGGAAGTADAGPPIVHPVCVSGGNGPCLPSGFPFVRGAFAHSTKACNGICPAVSPPGAWTIVFSQPQPGKLCLSGTNPDSTDTTGLLLGFSELSSDFSMVVRRFNADVLGITQVRFTLDSPPPAGITVSADTLHSDVCNGTDCITWGFALPNHITAAGITTAPLVAFVSNPPQTFDTRALDAISFDVGPGDFDFCVHDFHFLNAAGVEVLPSATGADAGAGNGAVDGSQG